MTEIKDWWLDHHLDIKEEFIVPIIQNEKRLKNIHDAIMWDEIERESLEIIKENIVDKITLNLAISTEEVYIFLDTIDLRGI